MARLQKNQRESREVETSLSTASTKRVQEKHVMDPFGFLVDP